MVRVAPDSAMIAIRLADDQLDPAVLQGIERAAAGRFPETVLPPSMRADTLSVEALTDARDQRLLWVAAASAEASAGTARGTAAPPVGFALARHTGRYLHLVEIDVLPAWTGQGVGTALLNAVLGRAVAEQCAAVTLTTFAGIPWNAPYYRKRGFADLEEWQQPTHVRDSLGREAKARLNDRVALAWWPPTSYRIEAYDPAWPERAREETQRLEELLPGVFDRIVHIGSTSVPGLAAKPTIDLMALLADPASLDERAPVLADAGYRAWGEYGLAGRRFFTRNAGDRREVNIHCFAPGNPHVARHLAFAAYLRTNRQAREEYAAVKRRAVQAAPADIDGYNDRKSAWIIEHERYALAQWSGDADAGR